MLGWTYLKKWKHSRTNIIWLWKSEKEYDLDKLDRIDAIDINETPKMHILRTY